MQAAQTFFLCCLTGSALAVALIVLMPHYAGMAHTLITFYILAAMVTATRMALRP